MGLFRKINKDKYTGGRGTAAGVSRSEKRRGGRIRCSSMTCQFGTVADISSCGIRVHCKRKPGVQVGDAGNLILKAEESQITIRAICVWIRVDDNCEFDMGWELPDTDAFTRRKLMHLAATATASEGLVRGWSPMEWWKKAV